MNTKEIHKTDSFITRQINNCQEWIQKHLLIWGLILITLFSGLRALQAYTWRLWFGAIEFYDAFMFALFLLLWIIIVSVGLIGGGIFWLSQTSLDDLGWQLKIKKGKTIIFGLIGLQLLSMNTIAWSIIGGARELPELFLPSITRLLMVVIFGFALPAWVEEVLFRGYLQPLLIKATNKWKGIVIQAVLFTVAHIGWFTSWTGFVSTFIAGLILGWLRCHTDSLISPFLAHGLLWTMVAFSPLVI